MPDVIQKVQVNIPFTMLYDSYLDLFVERRLNPEIGLDAVALERFSFSDFKRIAETLYKNPVSITLHGPFMDLSPASKDPAVRALTRRRFEQLLELVPLFRPISVVCHAGYDWRRYGFDRQEWIDGSLEMWSWLAKCLRNEGARLMLENVYEDGPQDIVVLFEQLEQFGVGFCLDTGHQAAFGKASLNDWLQGLGRYLGQLHLHDNHGQGDEHLAMGKGSIDFNQLFAYLKNRHTKPPLITLEPHEEKHLELSLAYLAEIWPW